MMTQTFCAPSIVDRDIPALTQVLDMESLLGWLQATPGLEWVKRVESDYVRYKPAMNALALVTLHGEGRELQGYVKAWRSKDAVKMEKRLIKQEAEGDGGRGRFLWPEEALQLNLLPNDDKLEALPWALTAEHMDRHLAKGARDLGVSRRVLESVETVVYKPERRHVARLKCTDGAMYSAKICTGNAFRSMIQGAWAPRPGKWLRVPENVRSHERRGLLIQTWLSGELLSDAWCGDDFEIDRLRLVGRALAEWHGTSVVELRTPDDDRDLQQIISLTRVMQVLMPALASSMDDILECVARGMPLMSGDRVPCHGDFYAKQVLLRDEEVGVIDFDEAHWGDANTDLGVFLSHLEREVLLGRIPRGRADLMRARFLDGYAELRGGWDERKLRFQTAVRLWARVPHFFRTRDPLWREHTHQLVDEVLRDLNQCIPPVQGKGGAEGKMFAENPTDPHLPWLNVALLREEVEDKVSPIVAHGLNGEVEGLVLEKALVLRHKRGKRVLISYRYGGKTSESYPRRWEILGKMRRRGMDMDRWQEWCRLYSGSMGVENRDGLGVARPLGWIREWGMTLQLCAEGEVLTGLIRPGQDLALMDRVAGLLAKFHAPPCASGTVHGMAEELVVLQKSLGAVVAELPLMRERVQSLLQACERLAREIESLGGERVRLHRDFYQDQVIVGRDGLVLLDLDLMCLGDPALDVGNLAAHLMEQSLREHGDITTLGGWVERFVQAYRKLNPIVSSRAIDIYTTLTLVRLVGISRRLESRRAWTMSLMEECEKRVGLQACEPSQLW